MAISQAELMTALQTLLSTVKFRLRGRRGTTAQLDPSLMKAGEFAFCTDTRTLYACYVDGVIEQVSHGFIPKATYATLAALQAAHPTGVASDYYMVGTGPYHLYNWGGSDWIDMGIWNDMSLYATNASVVQNINFAAPVGEIKLWPFAAAPAKHLFMQGAEINRITYADLWALAASGAIAEAAWATDKGKFSVGNGSTTFRLPDWSELTNVGYKSGSAEFGTLGKKYGEKVHTLSSTEIPSHTHQILTVDGTGGASSGFQKSSYNFAGNGVGYTNVNTGVQPGAIGNSHNNLQPSVATNYIIRALA